MSLEQKWRQKNLILTFNQVIESRMAALYGATYTDRIFYEDTMADPTALDELASALSFWLNVRYVSGGVGLKQPTIMQVDCYRSVGTGVTPLDRYGMNAVGNADDLIGAMSTADEGVRIKDYSVDPNSPTTTAEWFLIRNSKGQQGWPDERLPLPVSRGLLVEVVTWHVWHHQDLCPGVQLYF